MKGPVNKENTMENSGIINIDMTGVKTEIEPIPPGVYDATVVEVEQKTSKKGNPYLNWKFDAEPNPDTGFDGTTPAWYITSLLPDALWNLKRTLKALGIPEDELEGELQLDPIDLIGLECTLVIVADFYDGEETTRVDEVLPAGAEVDRTPTEDEDLF
ncbi:DUF669 domain-containing protein [bacterium]|nr:DUF669 domain-containing protein [bacterium]